MKCRAVPPRTTGETFVYIVTDGTFTKVGITNNPRKRLALLQNGNPRALRMIYAHEAPTDDAARRIEREVHSILKADGKRVRGEWFRVSPSAANFAHLKAIHRIQTAAT